MVECSNLATKPEVATKIDKSEKPQIVQASAAAAVPSVLAIVATYADEAAAIAREALQLARQGLSLAKSALGQIAKFLGGLANVLSLIGLLATQAQLLILSHDVQKLKEQLRQVSDIAEGAVIKADLAIAKANAATNIANIATTNAYAAIDKANAAINSAGRAEGTAEIARGEANQAITKANAAIGSADRAKDAANYASQKANQAISQSNQATDKANTAIQESNIAKTDARAATDKANLATDKANTAIALGEQNAVVIEQVKRDNYVVRAELFGIKFAQALIEAELDRQRQELAEKDKVIVETRTIAGVTKEYVIRKVEESKAIIFSGIHDLDERLTREESKTNSVSGVSATAVTKIVSDAIKEEDKSIKDYIAGLPGIRTGTKGDSLTVGQVRDIARTEAGSAVRGLEKVQNTQYLDLRDRVSAIPIVVTGAVTAGVVTQLKPLSDGIQRTVSQTAAPAITQAAAAGVCSTTQPGGCMNNLSNNQSKNISDYINAAGATGAAANNALLLRMQGILNTINTNTSIIKSTTNAIQKTVLHARYGLQAAQKFAETAWRVTNADKVLQVVNTTLLVHNAMMLSNSLAQTIGEATGMALNAIGIRDHEDQQIDVNSLVTSKINALLSSILGTENYKALTTRIAKANRIYQSSMNMLNATRNMFDATHSIAEITVRHTGQIGNALRESGAVLETAYDEMVEKVNPQSKRLMGLEKFRAGIEVTETAFDSVAEVSGNVLEIQENITELKTEKTTLINEMDLDITNRTTERENSKNASQAAAPNLADFTKDPID